MRNYNDNGGKGWRFMSIIKKHRVLLLFVCLMVATFWGSTWFNEWVKLSDFSRKISTVFLYSPFVVFIIEKLIGDFKNKKVNAFNIFYYLFAVYFGALSVYRMFFSSGIKEMFYVSVVFFGSLALFSNIVNKYYCITKKDIFNDLWIYSVLYVIFYFIDDLILSNYMYLSPINYLYGVGSMIMMLPIIVQKIKTANSLGSRILAVLVLAFTWLIIFTRGSRALFVLSFIVIVAVFLSNLKNKLAIKRMFVSALICIFSLFIVLFFDVNEARNNFFRSLSISSDSKIISMIPKNNPNKDSDDEAEKEEINDLIAQIERSDNMRADLLEYGLAEFKKNPLFGTGNIYYTYHISGWTFEQETHNFIVQTLAGYGIVGLVFCAILLILIMLQTGMFNFKNIKRLSFMLENYSVIMFFFGLGMVQPAVYNTQLLPLMMTLFAYLELNKNENSDKYIEDTK